MSHIPNGAANAGGELQTATDMDQTDAPGAAAAWQTQGRAKKRRYNVSVGPLLCWLLSGVLTLVVVVVDTIFDFCVN